MQTLFLAIALHDALQLSCPHYGVIANLRVVSQDLFDQLYLALPGWLVKFDLGVGRFHGRHVTAALPLKDNQLVPFTLFGCNAHPVGKSRKRFILFNNVGSGHIFITSRR